MISPKEIVSACVGELYRYRLAVHNQRSRTEAVIQEVRAERDQIAEDEYELLFAPSMSSEAFRRQLEEIHHRDVPLLWQLKTEAEFLLTAVYGIYTMTNAIRQSGDERVSECVRHSIFTFKEAAPDADLFRSPGATMTLASVDSAQQPRRPRAPSGLKSGGRKLWHQVMREYVLNAAEARLLEDACRSVDIVDALREKGSGPEVAKEIRLTTDLIRKLLGALGLPDEGSRVTSVAGRALALKRHYGR